MIDKCSCIHLRRKLLEKGRNLTLRQVQDIAKAFEDADALANSIEDIRTDGNRISLDRGARHKSFNTHSDWRGRFKTDTHGSKQY